MPKSCVCGRRGAEDSGYDRGKTIGHNGTVMDALCAVGYDGMYALESTDINTMDVANETLDWIAGSFQ